MKLENGLDALHLSMKAALLAGGIEVSEAKTIAYGLQFKVSTGKWSGFVRLFKNKKGEVRPDFSQLGKGPEAESILNLIHGTGGNLNVPGHTKLPGLAAPAPASLALEADPYDLDFPLIGTDESGKGDFFGPLVCAGIYVDRESADRLLELGVRDSKVLGDAANRALAGRIRALYPDRIAVIEILPERYNALYSRFVSEGKNLNTLLAWAHARALEEILAKHDCKLALADKFADERFIRSKLQEKGKKLRLVQLPKAERNVAVAAASILARERFLLRLDRLSEEFGLKLPKGASRAVEEAAQDLVRKQGRKSLQRAAKMHFKTAERV